MAESWQIVSSLIRYYYSSRMLRSLRLLRAALQIYSHTSCQSNDPHQSFTPVRYPKAMETSKDVNLSQLASMRRTNRSK